MAFKVLLYRMMVRTNPLSYSQTNLPTLDSCAETLQD